MHYATGLLTDSEAAGAHSSAQVMFTGHLAWPPASAASARVRAGKMLNGSVPAKSLARLWVMSGPPPARQSTGDLGCAALEVDGARTGEASGQPYTAERFAPGA